MSKLLNPLALSLACLLAACGSEGSDAQAPAQSAPVASAQQAGLMPDLSTATGPDADAPMTISSLVPEGSFAYVHFSSFDELSDLMNEFMIAFSGPSGMDFETALKFLPVEGVFENIDRTRELGLAIGFAEGSSEPAATIMLPVLDRGAVIQGLRTLPEPPQCFGIDDYVVATSLDEYRPGVGSALLTDGLPAGQVAARVDAQTVIEHIGPMLDMGLQQMVQSPEPGFEDVAQSLADGMRMAVKSAESLDFAINLEDGEVDFSLAFMAAPDSELDGYLPQSAGSLYDLARCLEGGDTMSMLVTVDAETVQKRLMPLYTKVVDQAVADGELDAALRTLMVEWGALWPMLGDSVVASLDAGGTAFSATYFCQPPDREAFIASLEALLTSLGRSLPSLRVSGPEKQGSVETAYTIGFDGDEQMREVFSGLFPSGNLMLRVAERRDITVITVGDDERAMSAALDRVARTQNEIPTSLSYVMERVGDANPAFVARLDLVSAIRDLVSKVEGRTGVDLLAEEGIAPDEGPLYLTYYGGVDGRVWRLGFRADVSHFGELIKQQAAAQAE